MPCADGSVDQLLLDCIELLEVCVAKLEELEDDRAKYRRNDLEVIRLMHEKFGNRTGVWAEIFESASQMASYQGTHKPWLEWTSEGWKLRSFYGRVEWGYPHAAPVNWPAMGSREEATFHLLSCLRALL